MSDKRIALSQKLKDKHPENLKMVIGFDGFVDEIIHAVDKRLDALTFNRIETIEALAKRIERASGLSTNIELVPVIKKIGGNGPIMCNALARHDASLTYLGALGVPNIDEVFMAMPKNVTIHSFANSGHTDALEFDDGKLMLGKMISLNDVTYDNLVSTYGKENLVNLLSNTDLLAMVNWSMLPELTNLWKKLLQEIVPLLPEKTKKPVLFVDLADPEKREDEEITDALKLLQQFNSKFYTIVGFNKKEAYDVAAVLDLFDDPSLEHMQVSLEDLNQALYEYLAVDSVVIHPVDRSCTVVNGTFFEEAGPYVKKPKLTTGAGDNFNAGFVLGMMLGLSPDEALLLGMSTSGFYVRNAYSPNFKELTQFLVDWAEDRV
ncbi:MAG: PfkB family carbohydrate kinase [Candidatus Izemoplasmatales bacterium]